MEEIILPELFPEKKEVFDIILEKLNQDKIGYINVPTGYGKTFISTHIMLNYLKEGKKILFIASKNKALLRQTFYKDEDKEIILFPQSICLSSDFPMSKWNEEKILSYIKQKDIRLVFASLQTLLSKKKQNLSDFFLQYFDIVIIDEIHNFIKNQGNEYINKIIHSDKECRIFGMTATPYQGIVGNIKTVREINAELNEYYKKTVSQCIIDGQLSPLNYYIVRNPDDIDDIFDFGDNFKGLYSKELSLNGKNLDAIIRRTKLAKKIYDEKIEKTSKTLVFCSPMKGIRQDSKLVTSFHAKLTAALFNEEIIDAFDPETSLNNKDENNQFKKAVYLSSDLNNQEIEDIIASFKTLDRPPFVLCTVGMLVEGFNFPLLKNLILLRPTLSMRLFSQEIGRVLRKDENKDVGNIYEIVDKVDIGTLYNKFGETILSGKRLKRLLMLNPEERLEKLLFQSEDDNKAILEGLIQVKEESPAITDIKTIDFSQFTEFFTEISRRFPPIDFRVKILANIIEKINLTKSGTFQKEHLQLIELVSKIRLISVEDVRDAIKLIKNIQKIQDENYNMELTQSVLQNKVDMFKDFIGYFKLKILTEVEKMADLNQKSLQEIADLLGYSHVKIRMENLKEQTLIEGKGQTLQTFMERLQIFMGVLTGELEKKLAKEIETGQISLHNPMFNKRAAQVNVLWAETYYHDDFDYLKKQYVEYYNKDKIKLPL